MNSIKVNKVLLFANTDWYLYNFRLPLANELRKRGCEVILVSPPGEYAARLQDAGFRWYSLPMERRSLNPLRELAVIAKLIQIYRKEKPDIVHHFTLKSVIYGALAARISNVSAIVNAVTGMGYVYTNDALKAKLLKPIVTQILKTVLRHAGTRLIVENPDDANHLVKNKMISQDYIRLIRGVGVDTNRYKPNSYINHGNTIKVLLATRLLWDKGVQEYIEAAKELKLDGLDAEFLVAGSTDEGNPTAIPIEQIQQWHNQGIIEAKGHVDDMSALLSAVHIVVLPSYREGLPTVLLEAAASGLAIIATDVPGCREIVSHRVNGLLVPVKDANSLAQAIKQLVNDPQLRSAMGKEGRKRAIREFDAQIVIEKTFGVYRELFPSFSNCLQTAA